MEDSNCAGPFSILDPPLSLKKPVTFRRFSFCKKRNEDYNGTHVGNIYPRPGDALAATFDRRSSRCFDYCAYLPGNPIDRRPRENETGNIARPAGPGFNGHPAGPQMPEMRRGIETRRARRSLPGVPV